MTFGRTSRVDDGSGLSDRGEDMHARDRRDTAEGDAKEPRTALPGGRSPGRPGRGSRTRKWFYPGAVAAAVIVLAGCGGSSSSSSSSSSASGSTSKASAASNANVPFQGSGTPVRGGVLHFARALQPTSFTPWIGTQNGDIFADMQIYDGLVEAAPNTYDPQPGLADSWTISPDKLIYTFHLRPKVKFSNGQPLTAQDVKWSLENAVNPNIDANYAGLFANIKSVSIPDPAHVKLTLKVPTPALLYNLTISGALILPEKIVKKLGPTKYGFHPVGTGPFMVTSFSPGSPTIQLKRNPYYWRPGLPYLDGITYQYVPDDNTRVLNVLSGASDIAENLPYSQISRVNSSSNAKVFTQHLFANDWIFINGFRPPLNNAKIRQAMAYATPFDSISRVVFHNVAPPAATANMHTKYWDSSLKPYPYDIAKAKQLLQSAGASSLPVTLEIVSGDAVAKQVASILQSSWGQAGIKLTIQQKDSNSVNTDLGNENFQLINTPPNAQTSDVPVDDEFDQYMVSDTKGHYTFVGWDNPTAKRLINQAITSPDESVRQHNFTEYQKLLWQDQPVIGLVYPPNLFAVRTNVHNFVAVGTGWPLLRATWLSH
jgi:peptide/nickel transport system substrate-binding protein